MTIYRPSNNTAGHWFENFRPNTNGDFNFSAPISTKTFTPCYSYDTEIELSSDLHAFIDQRAFGSSLVSLDESGNRLSWNWQIKFCEADLFDRPFTSYYTAPNGRTYRAILIINGDQGSFESEAGFIGELFNIRRSHQGRIAEGEWKTATTRGSFRFTITDAQIGRFSGYWKDQFNRQGNWWGEYN